MIQDFYSKLYTPQYSNFWEISIATSTRNTASFDAFAKNIKSVSLPFWKIETDTSPIGYKYITKVTKDTEITLEFWETMDWKVYRWFKDWQNLTYDPDTKNFKTPIEVRNGFLVFKDNNWEFNTKKFLLKGLIIKEISDFDLTYENGEGLVTKAVITADEVIEATN